MAKKKGRRQFGWIRQLPSGRYQASYLAPDGLRRKADYTFSSKQDAAAWLTLRQSELLRGEWVDPNRGLLRFGEYAARWVADRGLEERTRDRYRSLLRLHLEPFLGHMQLVEITPEVVRAWRNELLSAGRSATTAAGAYRLLRAILNTAVDDERIKRNPCRIKGGGNEQSAERRVASIPEVYALAGAVPSRFRALILVAAFTGLRWGELAGLRVDDVEFATGRVHVRRSLKQLDSGRLVEGRPKSVAGYRSVTLPGFLVGDLRAHIETFATGGRDARLFTGGDGGPLRRDNWHRDASWPASLTRAGLPAGFHFHDLRHTGNHLAAMSGASLRDLMRRMGQSSTRAAMIYQHATDDRDRDIATALDALVEKARREDEQGDDDDDDGLGGALAPVG